MKQSISVKFCCARVSDNFRVVNNCSNLLVSFKFKCTQRHVRIAGKEAEDVAPVAADDVIPSAIALHGPSILLTQSVWVRGSVRECCPPIQV